MLPKRTKSIEILISNCLWFGAFNFFYFTTRIFAKQFSFVILDGFGDSGLLFKNSIKCIANLVNFVLRDFYNFLAI